MTRLLQLGIWTAVLWGGPLNAQEVGAGRVDSAATIDVAGALGEVLDAEFPKAKVVGLVAGAVWGDQVWTDGRGLLAKGGEGAPDADTIFEIGSITKVFTGVLLADLAQRGVVSPEATVQSVLGDRCEMATRGDQPIRLVDLTTHRSGLLRMPTNFRPKDGKNPYVDYGADSLFEFLEDHRPSRPVGEEYAYSNLGVGLLGHSLSIAAKRPYADLIQERILKPLEMSSTSVHGFVDPQRAAKPHDALGRPGSYWDFDVLAPAGAMRSSVTDMLKFAKAQFDTEGLPKSLAAALTDARRVRARESGPPVAFGWHARGSGDAQVLHNGQTGGFVSFLAVVPKQKVAVVVLCNQSKDVNGLAFALFDRLRKLVDDQH